MSKKGFTIIELLIVIAVIAILVGIALPRFKGMQDEGRLAQAKGELRTLQSAVESYYIHNNNAYPATGSAALETALSTAAPSIIDHVPTDPFSGTGADYVYVMGGTNSKYYIIYSVGPGGNGSAVITADAVVETNPNSCTYISNMSQDTRP
jgi:general secretion pathway protein G